MKAIVNGVTSIIENLKLVIEMISTFFKSLGYLVNYILKIPTIFAQIQIAVPPWLRAFMILCLSISLVYILVGRVGGKSD